MKVSVRSARGASGLGRAHQIDTATLEPPERDRLHALVHAAKGSQRIPVLTDPAPDETAFEILIENDDGTSDELAFKYATAPTELQSLAAELTALKPR